MRLYFLLLTLIFSFTLAHANDHFHLRADHFTKKDQQYLAISFKNKKGWHTYWKNPGDAGLPVKILFQNITPQELSWPIPTTFYQDETLSYGYDGVYTFFYKLHTKDIDTLKKSPITIKSQLLICKNICVPSEQSIQFQIGKNLSPPASFTLSPQKISQAFNELPKTQTSNNFNIQFLKSSEKLYLKYSISNSQSLQKNRNLMTPYPHELLGFMREKLYWDQSRDQIIGLMEVSWDGEYAEPPLASPQIGELNSPLDIKFLLQDKKTSIKTSFVLNQLESFSSKELKKIQSLPLYQNKNQKKSIPTQHKSQSSLLTILLFAFLGGFILNFMPCVLPVISIKLMSLIQSRTQKKARLLKHNLSYTLGVLFTFLLMAITIHIIKSTGSQIGWGFQLQSPSFVIFITFVIFIMALNMFGFFEFKTPWGNTLGSKSLSESFGGDFFSGVISTILATPCSAPFLGTALTFAFTTSNFNIYIVFLSIGVGLSFPFIMIGFFPRLISFLPKPGKWMQKLKYLLGITLIITTIWLISIADALLQNPLAIYSIFAIFLFITLTFWLQKKWPKVKFILWAIPLISIMAFYQQKLHHPNKNLTSQTLNHHWKPWTPETMNKPKAKFINFTAAWCLTCKVNKKLILDRTNFYQFAKENHIELYEADWTHHDEVITKWLAQYKVVGVPAYFLQKENGEIIYLGEITSINAIKKQLEN